MQAAVVTSALERLRVPIPGWEWPGPRPPAAEDLPARRRLNPRGLLMLVLRTLLRRTLPLTEPQLLALLGLAEGHGRGTAEYWGILSGAVTAAANHAEADGLSEPLREATRRLVAHLRRYPDAANFRKAGAIIIGPKGVVELKQGVIRAAIHVHMNPTEAAYFGVSKGERMKLRIGGEAGLTFNNVHVRIDAASRLNVHMDTDEANACGLHLTKDIELFK